MYQKYILGVHGSHIPGTKCAPAGEMVSETGRMKDPAQLEACIIFFLTYVLCWPAVLHF